MVDVENQAFDPRVSQTFDDMRQKGSIANWHQWFGQSVGQRTEARTETRAEHHGDCHAGESRALTAFAPVVCFHQNSPDRGLPCYRALMGPLSANWWRALPPIFAGVLLCGPGCDPEPVGVRACRDIEQARCRAAGQCGTIDDVEACERYYRDQCLHGLPTDEVPEGVQDCVQAIEAAGDCAADKGSDAPVSDCGSDHLTRADGRRADEVCDLVEAPERLGACQFLDTDGAAGAAGASGD